MPEDMTSLERVQAALNFEEPDRVPVFPLIHFASSKIGGMKVKEFASDGEKMARALITAWKEFGYDGVHPGVDVVIEGEALGSVTVQPENATAYVKKPAIKEPEDLYKLDVPDPLRDGRMPVVVKATEICSKEIGNRVYIASWIMGPWNCASQTRGVEQLMFDIYDRPDFIKELLEFTTEVGFEYGRALIDAGANMVPMGEALCSPNFISPKHYKDLIVPYQKKLVKKLRDYGAEATLVHICGRIQPILGYFKSTGATAIDVDYMVDMKEAKEKSGLAVRGNLNPAGVLLYGTPKDVEEECKRVIQIAGSGSGLILGSGCDVALETPPENIKAMVQAAEKFGRYPLKQEEV
jgi:MtaA/CmuA family methyltransferase